MDKSPQTPAIGAVAIATIGEREAQCREQPVDAYPCDVAPPIEEDVDHWFCLVLLRSWNDAEERLS